MKRSIVCTMAAAMLMYSTASLADVACSFGVSGVNLYPDGWMTVNLQGSGYTKTWNLCPVSGSTVVNDGYSSSRTVPSDSCKAIFSTFLTAKSLSKNMQLNFHGPADCTSASLPADGFPTLWPFSLGLVN